MTKYTSELGELILGESVLGGGFPSPDFPEPPPLTPDTLLTKSRRRVGLPAVHWTVDGVPVPITDWVANMVADGGYDSMSGTIPESVARANPGRITQEAPVAAYANGDVPIWYGHLVGDPQIEGGVARLEATGYNDRAKGASDRRLYQTMDYSLYQDGGDPPMNFSPATEDIESEVRASSLWWKVVKDFAYSSGDYHPLAAWMSGAEVTRVAGDVVIGGPGGTVGDCDLRIQSFTGPSGSRTTIADLALSADFSFDETFDAPEDGVALGPRFNAPHTPGASHQVRVRNLRANGIAVGDEMLTSEVAADIGRALGYDVSAVTVGGQNALPFDLQGSWADDGLSYLSLLDDWRWLVLHDAGRGPVLDYGPWDSRVWRVLRGQNAVPSLTPLPLYSQVVVKYQDSAGKPQQVSLMADPNPLAARGYDRVWYETLTDSQPDDTLATTVASTILSRVSAPRYSGSVDIVGAALISGVGSAYSVRAGDTVDIADWAPGLNLRQRIAEVEFRPDGVRVGVEVPVTAAGVVAAYGIEQLRRKKGSK